MKTLISILCVLYMIFAVISLQSCALTTPYDWEVPEEFGSIEDAIRIIGSYPYQADHGEEWAFPHRTYEKGIGDCEDKAILFAYVLESLGYDVYLVVCINKETGKFHMVSSVNGMYYETAEGAYPYPELKEDYFIIITYSLETVLLLCEVI